MKSCYRVLSILLLGLVTASTAAAQIAETIGAGEVIKAALSEVVAWARSDLAREDATNVSLPTDDIDVELGLTLRIPYAVEFRFEDTIRSSEYVFLEFYVALNNDVIYFERYPETGYFENPDTYFDDSTSGKRRGSTYIGAEKWPCINKTDKLTFVAVLWQDTFRWHETSPGQRSLRDSDKTAVGHWINGEGLVGEGFFMTVGLKQRVVKTETLDVTVFNPYFMEEQHTDNGATKRHGDTFDHQFEAVMNYTRSYPDVAVIDPEEQATITINGLPSKGNWMWETANALVYKVSAGERKEDRHPVDYDGVHAGARHPGALGPYNDDWGAQVEGRNRIFFKSGAAKQAVPYTWGATFRPEPTTESGCTPIAFAVTCDDGEPSCYLDLSSWPPTATVTVQDEGVGIVAVDGVRVEGLTLSPSLPQTYDPPTTEPLVITATKAAARGGLIIRATDAVGNQIVCDPAFATLTGEVPETYALRPNYPNPFNPTTTITVEVPEPAHVSLYVYDAMGRRIARLVYGEFAAGVYEVEWDGTDDAGHALASGLYLYQVRAGTFTRTLPMVLLK